MTSDIAVARRYLLPPDRSFWHWQACGDVVAWQGGSTIAFRAELVQILRRLAPERLPPLSSLLLVLAATRDNWDDLPFEVGDSAAWGFTSEEAPEITALLVNRNGLRKLRELDPELRCSVEAKVVLAESVFEQVRPVATTDEAAIILQYLEHGIVEVLQEPTVAAAMRQPMRRLTHHDLRDLRLRIEAVDAAALRLRCRTSLDQLPLPATIELSQAQQVRNLLGLLQHDSELQGLARLARQLMAAVSLPRAVSDPDELQIGGISDITNRGPLDRLLLTELVHDDLTLAVRVSVNEALYLRRETPPRTPERERALLLETGIRSWGVPRVFATAVALALVATTDPHTRVAAFRAQGADAIPVDLLSRDAFSLLYPNAHRFITPRSHRHRFSQIDVETAADQPNRLILISRKQMRLAIHFMDSDVPALRHVRLMPHGKGAATSPWARTFKQLETPQRGFTLSRAQWDDGSEAFLDSRGLLHLRSSDRTIPEVTIVLADGELGGWCSDGRLWGAKYYTGRSREAAVDQDVYHGAIAGFIRGIL